MSRHQSKSQPHNDAGTVECRNKALPYGSMSNTLFPSSFPKQILLLRKLSANQKKRYGTF
ncbi:MAG: hypothetical protein A2W93_03635 [Bacteroidetes bacterium GWF2_43_63]|nr:MAG: hypothetical protein A2W93_03635 [Bacteroidetes bacterium GWF2_43_63]HBG70520.1 hypothetical protein [Bacteroidales bacterium]HCB61515.1 hypothetical protein [Bacteroidales bacterium]